MIPNPYDPCMLYMVTFTINIPQMLAYIPYMDPMGNGFKQLMGGSKHIRHQTIDAWLNVCHQDGAAKTVSASFLVLLYTFYTLW